MERLQMVRIVAPHIDTRPNIYYHKGTQLLDWATTPTLPGNVHMPSAFWKTDEPGS